MAQFFSTLLVLVCKHLMVRKRRFIHSIFEFVSPAILFVLFFSVWSSIISTHPNRHREHLQFIDEPVDISNEKLILKIFYYPNTTMAETLIAAAAQHLKIDMRKSDPELSYQGYWSCRNESELLARINRNRGDAGIIFRGLNDAEWPRKLNYTIRMKKNFGTHDYKNSPYFHEEYGNDYKAFVALQWAIDTSYIQLLTGSPVKQMLTIQHFPTPHSLDPSETALPIYWAMLMCTLLSPLTFFLFTVSRLVLERCSGVKELMKMVGVSTLTLQLSHLVNSLPACAVYVFTAALLTKITSAPMLPETNALLVMLFLLFYFAYIVALAFFCSTLLNTTNHAVSLAFAVYALTQGLGAYAGASIPNTAPMFALSGLVPHVPAQWFWQEVYELMKYDGGSTLGNMFRTHGSHSGSVAAALGYQLLQAVLLGALAWYMEQVRPGKYGMAKSWDFVFKDMVRCKKINPDKDSETETMHREQGEHFEEPPTNVEVGIKIDNVSKVFGGWTSPKTVALKNVNLEIYKGEITVLLGHNGAGKTTLMSIITGMYSASEGQVFIKGMDTRKNLTKIRKSIGLCPQHNLTFEDLTVKEHFVLFAMLKGATYQQALTNCDELLSQLKLQEKADNMSGQLSGGMRRRLQLGCALAGGAEVLILDEPTSGLDVETRRELWNLLLALRGARTVLLTTHFMEEADALGDRVAALHGGMLRCHATPMFLKRAVGTGYRLSLTLKPSHPKENVAAAVSNVIPDAQLKESTPTGMSFGLPSKDSDRFAQLFNVLEEQREQLMIKSMGVGVTTLEEVFLKLCSDEQVHAAAITNGVETNRDDSDREGAGGKYTKLSIVPLIVQQFIALLVRQFKYVLNKKFTFLLLELLVPILATLLLAYCLNGSEDDGPRNPPLQMNLDMYRDVGASSIFYNTHEYDENLLDLFQARYDHLKFVRSSDVIQDILQVGTTNKADYEKMLIAAELNKTTANALYTTMVRHATPVAVNMLSNMLAKLRLSWDTDPYTITTVNFPVDNDFHLQEKVQPKTVPLCIIWAVGMAGLCSLFLVPAITLPVLERVSGARHLRIMAGVPPVVHYAAMWLFHLAVFSVTAVPTVLLAAGLLDYERTFDNAHFLGSLCGFMLLFAAAFTQFMYALSYFTGEGGATSILNIIILIFCFVTPPIRWATGDLGSVAWNTVHALCMVFPPYAFSLGLIKMTLAATHNAYCNLNEDVCPKDFELNYFDFESSGAGSLLVALIVHICVYKVIVLLLESGVFNRLWDVCWNYRYATPEPYYRDERVAAEKQYVDGVISTNDGSKWTVGKDAALVHGVHKNYRSAIGKSCNSVKGLTFSVKHGECFGLLGVNGAGKTSIFKILTGSEHATRGDVHGNGYSVNSGRAAYLSTLAYCPQFGGLDNFLSGWDNVELMVRLRGVPEPYVHDEVKSWIDYVDLANLKHRPVGAYSGGCARRAATAAALAGVGAGAGRGARRLALLDEPTAGVDAGARRRVWAALRRTLARGLSVVITSHSMDETEALCSRIAIMSRGELATLGSASELRAAHAAGYSAQLKLRTPQAKPSVDSTDGVMQAMSLDNTDYSITDAASRLKEYIRTNFNSVLKDEHKTMLHYHIGAGIRYSELFSRMEELKRQFPDLLEDYTISEGTLEEVFLSFAKDATSDHLRADV